MYKEYKGYYVIKLEDPKYNVRLSKRYNGLSTVIPYWSDEQQNVEVEDVYERRTETYNINHKSMKVRGVLRITRDLTLKHNNDQVHMMLFLDKRTPSEYLYPVNTSKDNGYIERNNNNDVLTTTWYIRSPFENDKSNQRLLKSLLSEEEYNSFMSKRFSCTYVAVECELSDFMVTGMYDLGPDLTSQEFYSDKYSVGNDISIKAEYFRGTRILTAEDSYLFDNIVRVSIYKHALMKNYKVVDRYSVSIYLSKTYDEDYFYSSYAKNGVIALPCSNDEHINVRNKIGNDSKVILQIQRVLATCNLPVYNRSENITEPHYEKENFTRELVSGDTGFDFEKQLKLLKYKIYPIFVHDILEGDWCKVTIYKSQYMYNFTNFVDASLIQAGNLEDINNLHKKIVYSPEEVYLMDGYIHASQLHPISVIRVKDTI